MLDDRTENRQSAELVRRLLLGGGVLVLLGIIQGFSPRHADLWWQTFFDTLHAPFFGLIAVALIAMTPFRWHWRRRLLVALAIVFALSLLSEAAQIPLPNRNASVSDLVNDWLGALAFMSFAVVLSPNFHVPPGRGRYLVLLAVILMAIPLKPLARVSAAYWERYQQLPSIAPFQSPAARMFYSLKNAYVLFREDANGRLITEVRFAKQGPSNIKFHDPWSDWRSFGTLRIDIDNLGTAALPLTIRIHDEAHLRGHQPHNDRFNRRLRIEPGRQSIEIALEEVITAPADRNMDMARIDGLVLFGSGREAGFRFILHDIRLE